MFREKNLRCRSPSGSTDVLGTEVLRGCATHTWHVGCTLGSSISQNQAHLHIHARPYAPIFFLYQCVVASCMPPTGDLARNPGMCPDCESNQQPFGSQAVLNPLSYTSWGHMPLIFIENIGLSEDGSPPSPPGTALFSEHSSLSPCSGSSG